MDQADVDIAERLAAARARVLADATATTGTEPPAVTAAAPLAAPPEHVRTKVATRVAAGYSPTGPDSPGRRLWPRVIVPAGVLAVADAVGLGVAAAGGHRGLAIVAAVLLVVLGGITVLGVLGAVRDPLRFTAADTEALAASTRWRSDRPWAGTALGSPACGLVRIAASSVENAAARPLWLSLALDHARLRLAVAATLDSVDAAAFAAAGDPTPPQALVERVAAIACYAEEIAALDAATGGDQQATLGADDVAGLRTFLGLAG